MDALTQFLGPEWAPVWTAIKGIISLLMIVVPATVILILTKGKLLAAEIKKRGAELKVARDQGMFPVLEWAVRTAHRDFAAFRSLWDQSMPSDQKKEKVADLILTGVRKQLGPEQAAAVTKEELELRVAQAQALWQNRKSLLKGELDDVVGDLPSIPTF